MEQQFCEKCHKSGIKVLLRQSEELLYSPCWKGWPPSWDINKEHQELDLDRVEAEVDHSFRFTFSTPSIIEDINNTALQNNKSIVTSKQTEEVEHTKVSPLTPKLITIETPTLPHSHGTRLIKLPWLNEIELKFTSEENGTKTMAKTRTTPHQLMGVQPLHYSRKVTFCLLIHCSNILQGKRKRGLKNNLSGMEI